MTPTPSQQRADALAAFEMAAKIAESKAPHLMLARDIAAAIREHAAALAQADDTGAGEWQPIETAPHATRGLPIDIWFNGRRFTDVHWTDTESGGWADASSCVIWLRHFKTPGPTHWMRTPPPTSADTTGEAALSIQEGV